MSTFAKYCINETVVVTIAGTACRGQVVRVWRDSTGSWLYHVKTTAGEVVAVSEGETVGTD